MFLPQVTEHCQPHCSHSLGPEGKGPRGYSRESREEDVAGPGLGEDGHLLPLIQVGTKDQIKSLHLLTPLSPLPPGAEKWSKGASQNQRVQWFPTLLEQPWCEEVVGGKDSTTRAPSPGSKFTPVCSAAKNILHRFLPPAPLGPPEVGNKAAVGLGCKWALALPVWGRHPPPAARTWNPFLGSGGAADPSH